jgi:hypothetical protein
VSSLKGYIEDEITLGTGADAGGVYEERSADKPACRFPPPVLPSRQKSALGTLVVGCGFSNYNIVRHLFSDGEFQFDGDEGGPQLLCQITMADSKSEPNSPPMVRFSAPSTHMLAILENERFRRMIESRKSKRTDTPRPQPAANTAASDESD